MTDKGRVIALGFFDGVHIGHKALLDRVNERAAEHGLIPSVINFDTHPDSLVFNRKVDLIYDNDKRIEIINKEFGISDIIMIHFDRAMMETPWDEFLRRLIEKHSLRWVVIGYDFRFGWKGLGTPDKVSQFCRENGIGFDLIPAVEKDGETVSSTLIRSCISSGEMEKAEALLGRPFSISGEILHGHNVGTRIGYPTINLIISEKISVPSFGVYATQTLVKGMKYPSITNVGTRPTFYTDSEITVETNILDYSEDLYEENAEIYFYKKIRSEQKFSSPEELTARISKDVEEVRRFFAEN